MAYPNSPSDGAGYRIGMIVKKVGATLTAAVVRAIALTSGSDPVGWAGMATHVEDVPAAYSDASSETPLVLIGGKRGSHVTLSAAGDVGAIQVDAIGQLNVAIAPRETTIWASAARTATPTKADQINYGGRGVIVTIDVTAITATPSVTPTIQGKDTLSGKYYTILAGVAITGTGTTVLRVYPGLTAAANLVASDVLPAVWAIDMVHGDTDSITYTVSANHVP